MSSRRESDFERLQQLLREERERTELERGRRAELERERAELERGRRAELEERAELERERAELERGRREELERELAELERSRVEAESLAHIEEKKTRRTTFEEYIRNCHTLLSKPLRIQTDKSLGTQGSITSPKNKPCPTLLKPWTDFPILQQQLFEKVYQHIPSEMKLFSSTQYLNELGQDLCDRPFASEKDLKIYERLAVERPTTNIISHLQEMRETRNAFNLSGGIVFENHVNSLANENEEVQQSLQNLQLSSKSQGSSSNAKPKDADQICVYKETDGRRSLCLVVEYKPSHKLSVFNLRAGLLRADHGSMNLPKDVINRPTIPTDSDEKFVYHSEWLVGAALTQTYGYMIESGLEYSYLTTGEAFIFLWIKKNEPHTLYYHLAEPNIEAEAQDEVDILLCRTAVSQTLTFCLLALASKPRSQRWRTHTLETACRAVIDHEAILQQIPAEDRTLTPPSSVYQARIHPVQRSPIVLRPKKSRKARNSCSSTDRKVHEDPQSPPSSSNESSDIETPSKSMARSGQSRIRQSRETNTSRAAEESDTHHRQYCTQACLLGLVQRRPLDEACPNVSAHRAHGTSNRHPLEQKTLAEGIRHQLEGNLDNGCEPLGKQGARGALFRLALDSFGYTFVAKGTVKAFIPNLKHEGQVYRHLAKVQGELIPVYLGNISLTKPYFFDFGVRIVHMLLMSWAGEQAQECSMSSISRDMNEEINQAVTKMLECGVKHGDIRPPNVLWNPKSRKVMLVDFERSVFLKVPILQEISPNREQKRLHFSGGESYAGASYQLVTDLIGCHAQNAP